MLARARDRVHGPAYCKGATGLQKACGENRRGFVGSRSRGADRNLVEARFVEQLNHRGDYRHSSPVKGPGLFAALSPACKCCLAGDELLALQRMGGIRQLFAALIAAAVTLLRVL